MKYFLLFKKTFIQMVQTHFRNLETVTCFKSLKMENKTNLQNYKAVLTTDTHWQ